MEGSMCGFKNIISVPTSSDLSVHFPMGLSKGSEMHMKPVLSDSAQCLCPWPLLHVLLGGARQDGVVEKPSWRSPTSPGLQLHGDDPRDQGGLATSSLDPDRRGSPDPKQGQTVLTHPTGCPSRSVGPIQTSVEDSPGGSLAPRH